MSRSRNTVPTFARNNTVGIFLCLFSVFIHKLSTFVMVGSVHYSLYKRIQCNISWVQSVQYVLCTVFEICPAWVQSDYKRGIHGKRLLWYSRIINKIIPLFVWCSDKWCGYHRPLPITGLNRPIIIHIAHILQMSTNEQYQKRLNSNIFRKLFVFIVIS